MNIKRSFTWLVFLVIVVLIVVSMVAASKKQPSSTAVAIALPAPVTSADWVRGPANAPVTLVEYGDFQCPACHAYYPVVEQVFASSSGTLRMVFRHFPLSQHANAIPAAKAAEAAGAQGKFWQMYSLLYTGYDAWVPLPDPTSVFMGYAQSLHLDASKFAADMDSPATLQKITSEEDVAAKAGVDATPTFFVNGSRIENPESLPEFMQDIQHAASSTRS